MKKKTAQKIVKLMKERLGPFKELLRFLEDLRVKELAEAEPDGVWDDLEANTA